MRFSIILPVYNKAGTIIQALDSIYSQTCNDFEVIVVNDGSTDNVLDVLKSYDKPISVISQENKGVSVARNIGIENAKGDYICFLDADDKWFPNHLEVIQKMMTLYPEEQFFGTCHKCSYPNGNVVDCNKGLSSFGDIFLISDYLGFVNKYGGYVNTNSICVQRIIFFDENIMFEPGERMGEDVDVWYRIALKHSIVFSKQLTTLYRREYSTATTKTSNPPNWCFANRRNAILNDKEIADNKKESYVYMCDRYYMAISRELSYHMNKEEAIKRIMQVKDKFSLHFIISFTIVLLPSFVLKLIPSGFKK